MPTANFSSKPNSDERLRGQRKDQVELRQTSLTAAILKTNKILKFSRLLKD